MIGKGSKNAVVQPPSFIQGEGVPPPQLNNDLQTALLAYDIKDHDQGRMIDATAPVVGASPLEEHRKSVPVDVSRPGILSNPAERTSLKKARTTAHASEQAASEH